MPQSEAVHLPNRHQITPLHVQLLWIQSRQRLDILHWWITANFFEVRERVRQIKEKAIRRLKHTSTVNKPIVGDNVFTQTAGIHADGDKRAALVVETEEGEGEEGEEGAEEGSEGTPKESESTEGKESSEAKED